MQEDVAPAPTPPPPLAVATGNDDDNVEEVVARMFKDVEVTSLNSSPILRGDGRAVDIGKRQTTARELPPARLSLRPGVSFQLALEDIGEGGEADAGAAPVASTSPVPPSTSPSLSAPPDFVKPILPPMAMTTRKRSSLAPIVVSPGHDGSRASSITAPNVASAADDDSVHLRKGSMASEGVASVREARAFELHSSSNNTLNMSVSPSGDSRLASQLSGGGGDEGDVLQDLAVVTQAMHQRRVSIKPPVPATLMNPVVASIAPVVSIGHVNSPLPRRPRAVTTDTVFTDERNFSMSQRVLPPPPVTVKPSRWASLDVRSLVAQLVMSPVFELVIIVASLFAVFADDARLAAAPKSADPAFYGLLCVVLALFVLETVVNMVAVPVSVVASGVVCCGAMCCGVLWCIVVVYGVAVLFRPPFLCPAVVHSSDPPHTHACHLITGAGVAVCRAMHAASMCYSTSRPSCRCWWTSGGYGRASRATRTTASTSPRTRGRHLCGRVASRACSHERAVS
jgi:hypothetical protein